VPGYRFVIAPRVAQRIRDLPPDIKRGIREAMRAIAEDPARGEPLKRELSPYMKYKVRRFRIVYQVDRGARTIRVMAVGHRRSVYEELAVAIKRSSSMATT
jgi:mRNA interferase RelE/StbE